MAQVVTQVAQEAETTPQKAKYSIVNGPNTHNLLTSLDRRHRLHHRLACQTPKDLLDDDTLVLPVEFKIKDASGETIFIGYVVCLYRTNQPDTWIIHVQGMGEVGKDYVLIGAYVSSFRTGECLVYHKSVAPDLVKFFAQAVNSSDE